MVSWHPKKCKGCGAQAADGAWISKRGWCGPCGEKANADGIIAMANKTGPLHDKWIDNGGPLGRKRNDATNA